MNGDQVTDFLNGSIWAVGTNHDMFGVYDDIDDYNSYDSYEPVD